MAEMALKIQELQRAEWEQEPLRSWATEIAALRSEQATLLEASPAVAELARKEEDLRNFRSAVDTLLRALQTSPHSMQVASFGLMTSAWSAVRGRLGDEMVLPTVPDQTAFAAGETEALAQWESLRKDMARQSREILAGLAVLRQMRTEANEAETGRNPTIRALSDRMNSLESQANGHLSQAPGIGPLAARLQLMADVQVRLGVYRTRFQHILSARQPHEPTMAFPE
jgi:hypothetical protein